MKSFENKYLLIDDDKINQRVEKKIDKAISLFVKKILSIRKKYRTSGIGDTETDSVIIDEIYEKMHYRD
jgi:hypothetical protein